jgi:hypothetical protein
MRLATTPRSGYIFSTMPQTYDTTFKELFAQNFVALLRWLIPDVKSYEVLKLPEELPLTARRADLMVRVDGRASGRSRRLPSVIQIFDCQVQRDPRLPRSMLTRAVLAHDLYELPVKTTLLALTPKAVVQARYVFGTDDDGEESRHSVTVRRVFEESADAALKSDLAELLPLVPVMQPATEIRPGWSTKSSNESSSESWPTRNAKSCWSKPRTSRRCACREPKLVTSFKMF